MYLCLRLHLLWWWFASSFFFALFCVCAVVYSNLVGGDTDDEEEDDGEIAASRYKPLLKKILLGLLGAGDPLSFEDFPSVMPMPEANASTGTSASARRKKKHHGGVEGSARKGSGQKRWNKANETAAAGKKPASSFTGGRSIVFTVGGMSHSEMRVARDIMAQESREIIFGSTSFITAKNFVEDLASLS